MTALAFYCTFTWLPLPLTALSLHLNNYTRLDCTCTWLVLGVDNTCTKLHLYLSALYLQLTACAHALDSIWLVLVLDCICTTALDLTALGLDCTYTCLKNACFYLFANVRDSFLQSVVWISREHSGPLHEIIEPRYIGQQGLVWMLSYNRHITLVPGSTCSNHLRWCIIRGIWCISWIYSSGRGKG